MRTYTVECSHSWNVGLGVRDDHTVLDVETTDFRKSTGGGVVGSQELSDNGEFRVGIDGQARSVEAGVSHTEGVEIATGLIADTCSSVGCRALGASTFSLADVRARVRSVGGSLGVGFPDIHFAAASTHGSCTGIRIGARANPALDVGL